MSNTPQSQHSASASTRSNDPYKGLAYGVLAMVVLTIPAMLAVVQFSQPGEPVDPMVVAAEQLGLDVEVYTSGLETFTTACVLCHGARGHGVAKLGRPLRNSEFVQNSSDDELIDLITNGRLPNDPANNSGTLMPARGANLAVTDDKIPAIVAFLRTMQEEGAPFADASAWYVPLEERLAAAEAAQEAAAESGIDLSGPVYDLYVSSCSACHGPQGEGMEGTGKPFIGSKFVLSKTDKELMTFIKMGRPPWDAENTTGIDMPSKGGNPALKDEEIADLITFIRSIAESGE